MVQVILWHRFQVLLNSVEAPAVAFEGGLCWGQPVFALGGGDAQGGSV